jgi:hypothetical protein
MSTIHLPEFRAFSKIEKFGSVPLFITQKIHGTNAQIHIWEDPATSTIQVMAGSRNKWLSPGKGTDNFGFAQFVEDNRQAFIDCLGIGTHYGEWAGPGINSGEGLTDKMLLLFNWQKFSGMPLPERVSTIPVLYQGALDTAVVHRVAAELKEQGSRLVPGFMRVEGIVVTIGATRYKYVYDAEETKWTKSDGRREAKEKALDGVSKADYSHLCQPLRLEKLLSRDEMYLRDFPKSLPLIVRDYVADLTAEGQITGDEDEQHAVRKAANSLIFKFVKSEAATIALTRGGNSNEQA